MVTSLRKWVDSGRCLILGTGFLNGTRFAAMSQVISSVAYFGNTLQNLQEIALSKSPPQVK